MALDNDQKSAIRFHLGYSQDKAIGGALSWLNSVMDALSDSYVEGKVDELIFRCEDAYFATQYTDTSFAIITKTTTVTGDAALVTTEKRLPSREKRWGIYVEECQFLADTLGVDSYRF